LIACCILKREWVGCLRRARRKIEARGASKSNHLLLLKLAMDHSEPKTRKEMKGRDRERDANPYSQKRVRQLEALMEKRLSVATSNAGKKPSKN
jgi:hypothetical protein